MVGLFPDSPHIPKRNVYVYLFLNCLRMFIDSDQKLDNTQMLINSRVDKKLWYIHVWILYSNENKGILTPHTNMVDSHKHGIERRTQGTKWYTLYNSIYIKYKSSPNSSVVLDAGRGLSFVEVKTEIGHGGGWTRGCWSHSVSQSGSTFLGVYSLWDFVDLCV